MSLSTKTTRYRRPRFSNWIMPTSVRNTHFILKLMTILKKWFRGLVSMKDRQNSNRIRRNEIAVWMKASFLSLGQAGLHRIGHKIYFKVSTIRLKFGIKIKNLESPKAKRRFKVNPELEPVRSQTFL